MVSQSIFRNLQNLAGRMKGIRFATFLIMLFFFMDKYLSGFRADVRILGERCNILILPFLQTSGYYMKLALLGAAYFYSNAPFMEREELFYICRLGKERWGRRNLFYLAGSSFLLSLCFLIVSCILTAPVGRISLSWDSVYKTLALTGGANLNFGILYEIMKNYTPFQLLLYVLLLDWLAVLFLELLMYAAGLCGYRAAAGVLAILVVFLPSIDKWLGGRLLYYSPMSWLNCANWRVGYDQTKPDLAYMLAALAFLNLLLILFSQRRVRRMEWETME